MYTLLVILVIVGIFIGAPLFAGLGLIAVLSFYFIAEVPIQALISQAKMLMEAPGLGALPLFTLMGYILSASKTSDRLSAFSQSWLGWLPGGLAVSTVFAYTIFGAITGGSSLAVMALGGIFYESMRKVGYQKNFCLNTCTVPGGEGLLFPPSLAIIVLGLVAHRAIGTVYMAALIPGLFVVFMDCLYSVVHGIKEDIPREKFSLSKALSTLKPLLIEAPLPFLIIGGISTPWLTITEIAILCLTYTIVTQCFIRREVPLKVFFENLVSGMILIGAIFTILVCALGFSSFVIDVELPQKLLEWLQQVFTSRLVFLMILNIFLLITGCLMDVFSAILVMVPLLLPVAVGFNVDPVHFCVLFVWNLAIGYSTPPIGFNLFIGSHKFNEPIEALWVAALPRIGVQLISLLVITYIPELSLFLIRILDMQQEVLEMI